MLGLTFNVVFSCILMSRRQLRNSFNMVRGYSQCRGWGQNRGIQREIGSVPGNVSLNDETDQSKRTKQYRTVSHFHKTAIFRLSSSCMSTHRYATVVLQSHISISFNNFIINCSICQKRPPYKPLSCNAKPLCCLPLFALLF